MTVSDQDVAVGTYDATGGRSPQWWPSRYGADDEIGAANELTPDRTLAALQIPKEGRSFQLGQLLTENSPGYGQRFFKQVILAHETAMPICPDGTRLTCFEESVSTTFQIGTHLDTLGHVGIDGRFYNGNHYEDFYTPTKLTKLGTDSLPAFVSRGVVLDVAGLLGVEQLEPNFEITVQHLEDACDRQETEVRAGDALVIHTGWGDLWNVDSTTYTASEPGPGWDAAHWMTDRRISVVGADTWGVEQFPGPDPLKVFSAHQHWLAETGTFIVENIRTRELVEAGASEFLWMMSPIRTEGSTGSMVSPVAII
ncbi:MAG: cyclase family protein [Actinomycetales bacterium]|nr:MAG: cyclase family protein [Actinomycetales bacterium]